MKKINRIICLVFLLISFSGCQSIKDGLEGNKKSKSAEEFLIEKKNPLVLPPNFSKLPTPTSEENSINETDFEIEDILSGNEGKKNSDNKTISDTSLEQSILKKIKNN
jgi:hypothetical protein